MAAAVADFAPKRASSSKIKRGGGDLQIDLVANPDIIAEVGEMADGTAPVPGRLRRRERRPRGERAQQAARQGPRPDRRQQGRRAVRRDRLRREQGHRLRRRGRAQRLADAPQAAGRRTAVGPDRGPLPQGTPAGASRATGPLPPSADGAGAARRPRAAGRDPRTTPGRRLGRLRPDHGGPPRRPAVARPARAAPRTAAWWSAPSSTRASFRPSTSRARCAATSTASWRSSSARGPTSSSCRRSSSLYPPDDVTRVTVEGLTRQLEGASRPGHLDGLTTVMLKMLHLVGPASLYLGQRTPSRS